MRIEKRAEFSKVKDGIAYGWAIVSTIKGEPYVDLHGDWIPPETLAPVAAEFMASARVGKDMHQGGQVAEVVFCLPVDGDVEKGVGLRDEQDRTGLVIGWKPSDPSILTKIANGERVGFSIGGLLVESDTEKRITKNVATEKANEHKRTFRSWKLCEISLVDSPAQEGALVGIVKRRPLAVVKSADKRYLTDVVTGHQHEVCCYEGGDAWMTDATAEGAMSSHRHVVTRGVDGALAVLTDSGHTHTLTELPRVVSVEPGTVVVTDEEAAKRNNGSPSPARGANVNPVKKETTMDPEQKIKELEAALAQLKAELAASKADTATESTMTDAAKALAKTLDGEALKRFRQMSISERAAEVNKALEADPVVVTFKGVAYRNSMGAHVVELAKQAKESAELVEKARIVEITKSTIGHFVGTDEVRQYLVKSVLAGGGSKELIDGALESLKGSNEIVKSRGKAPGFGGQPDPVEKSDDPVKVWNTAVAKFAKDREMKDLGKAEDIFLTTEEGRTAKRAYDTAAAEQRRQLA